MCFSFILLALSPEICSNTIVPQISWQLYVEISCLAGFNLEKPGGHLSSAKWSPHSFSSLTFRSDILWPCTLLHSWVYDFNEMHTLLSQRVVANLKTVITFSHLFLLSITQVIFKYLFLPCIHISKDLPWKHLWFMYLNGLGVKQSQA